VLGALARARADAREPLLARRRHGVRSAGAPRRRDAAAPALLVVDVVGAVAPCGSLPAAAGLADRRRGRARRRGDEEGGSRARQTSPPGRGRNADRRARAHVRRASAVRAPSAPAGPVHLNTATLEDLDALPASAR
jgi:hypothetical protein